MGSSLELSIVGFERFVVGAVGEVGLRVALVDLDTFSFGSGAVEVRFCECSTTQVRQLGL